jgi:hypothetical protein
VAERERQERMRAHEGSYSNSSHRRGAEPTVDKRQATVQCVDHLDIITTDPFAHSIGFYSMLIPLLHSTSLSTKTSWICKSALAPSRPRFLFVFTPFTKQKHPVHVALDQISLDQPRLCPPTQNIHEKRGGYSR